MTVSEKIFELLAEKGMSQKEFSEKTGIAQSSISDWKRKKTNPGSDKILTICDTLSVTPYELLSGTESLGSKNRKTEYIVLSKDSGIGMFVEEYMQLDSRLQSRMIGYMKALQERLP